MTAGLMKGILFGVRLLTCFLLMSNHEGPAAIPTGSLRGHYD
jgi:hypothetical protein